MDRKTLTNFFEEVETTEEYNGYFCSIAEAISIVVLGSICGFTFVVQLAMDSKEHPAEWSFVIQDRRR